jgi:FtsH-binding integral membrane protein
MNDTTNPYRAWGMPAIQAPADERTDFIRKTYLHLAGAVFGFVAIEAALLNMSGIESFAMRMAGNWWLVLIAFMGVSWLANTWAQSSTSQGMQYLGLALYVVAEAIIILPLMYIAQRFSPGAIPAAALITAVIFGGLTAIVFMSGADFSFLRTGLCVAGFAAMGVVIASMIFGFSLGIVFSGAMILFASGYILYDTSNIMHHYRIGQHVAASLALFASVALLFWYVLRIVMALSSRD